MITACRRTHLIEHVHIQLTGIGSHLFTVFQNLLGTQIQVIQDDIFVFIDGDSRFEFQCPHATTANKGQFVDGRNLPRTEMMF